MEVAGELRGETRGDVLHDAGAAELRQRAGKRDIGLYVDIGGVAAVLGARV